LATGAQDQERRQDDSSVVKHERLRERVAVKGSIDGKVGERMEVVQCARVTHG
jgi:hypothetical protein